MKSAVSLSPLKWRVCFLSNICVGYVEKRQETVYIMYFVIVRE
jgi:hypothetical protein